MTSKLFVFIFTTLVTQSSFASAINGCSYDSLKRAATAEASKIIYSDLDAIHPGYRKKFKNKKGQGAIFHGNQIGKNADELYQLSNGRPIAIEYYINGVLDAHLLLNCKCGSIPALPGPNIETTTCDDLGGEDIYDDEISVEIKNTAGELVYAEQGKRHHY
jgi:hypothetical protein